MLRPVMFILFFTGISFQSLSQCGAAISSFPYQEDFETTDGGWQPGGSGSDWAWGTPAKTVITGAGGGTKCWIIGGLTGSSYTNAEASWIQSPCFDFSSLSHPYITFKVFWEMEQQYDGGGLQYSLDNGGTWASVGAAGDPVDCLHANWFNFSPINFLAPLSTTRDGWSGNIQSSAGSCKGGNGSNGWVTAKHTMPYLAGKPSVLFRFIFGAGTICNNYDGFAVDDLFIGEAPPNSASFTYACNNSTSVSFTNTSALCPATYSWDFGDPASGTGNVSALTNPTHVFSGPGSYTVSLTASGPGNAPSTITQTITILQVKVMMLTAADCQTNTGGSLVPEITGGSGIYNYTWNTNPVQTGMIAANLGTGSYTVTVSGTGVCPATGTGVVEPDLSCIGIYFPSAFTPNNDGKNDGFGPLGSLASLKDYQLSIYNRWGERVFYSTNPFDKWNGMVRGVKTDGNLFVWFSSFSLPGKSPEFRKGTFVLIR